MNQMNVARGRKADLDLLEHLSGTERRAEGLIDQLRQTREGVKYDKRLTDGDILVAYNRLTAPGVERIPEFRRPRLGVMSDYLSLRGYNVVPVALAHLPRVKKKVNTSVERAYAKVAQLDPTGPDVLFVVGVRMRKKKEPQLVYGLVTNEDGRVPEPIRTGLSDVHSYKAISWPFVSRSQAGK